MRVALFILVALWLWFSSGSAQVRTPAGDAPHEHRIFIAFAPASDAGDQTDSAYIEYKNGYTLILDEKWNDARRHFENVISRYSHSAYVDDAQYWSAYALMHTDHRKAIDAYKRFLRRYPRSSYFDDAIADFARLHVEEPVSPPPPDTLIMHPGNIGGPVVIDLQRLQREMESIHLSPPYPPQPPVRISITMVDDSATMLLNVRPGDAKFDRHVQLKIESLRNAVEKLREEEASQTLAQCLLDQQQPLKAREYAVAMLNKAKRYVTQKTFQSLRKVVLDQTQPLVLREQAISCLSKADQFDVLPVFREIARKDANERSRVLAIEAIGQCNAPKSRSLETLIDLFKETPRDQIRQHEVLLDAIADVDNDNAFRFIKEVAEKDENEKVQKLAIYHIGEMETDRNRSVETLAGLFNALPPDRRDQRETIMYSIANIGNDKAIEFLSAVAGKGESEEMRSKAIFYLTNIGGEKAREALYKVLEPK